MLDLSEIWQDLTRLVVVCLEVQWSTQGDMKQDSIPCLAVPEKRLLLHLPRTKPAVVLAGPAMLDGGNLGCKELTNLYQTHIT